ncbi:putative transcriptional regulatory protein [Colletotrichum spinosum]|uniref:Putative transcriptional regulatory protein n=1 Tax=Colletotrichum spinosum TaxID=1347390 RepID=A0A4R8PXT0_9PEZI|nr:putative transcriptional regulatory protein [Colletotrichum spinosum]
MANTEAGPSNQDAQPSRQNNTKVRKKRYTPRSQTGCLTCRDAKVKCEETRPVCNRCAKSRRACVYPPHRNAHKHARAACRQLIAAPAPPLVDFAPDLSPLARRSLDYFHRCSSREFAGYFDVDFWKYTVPRTAQREPCVRQILVALGARHEAFRCEGAAAAAAAAADAVLGLRTRAFEEYQKAIGMVVQHCRERERTHLEVTLTCAVLFVAFEWLQRNYVTAKGVLEWGMGLVADWLTDEVCPRRPALGSPEGYRVREQLKPILVSMALQCHMLPGPPRIPLAVVVGEGGGGSGAAVAAGVGFSNLVEARDHMLYCLARLHPEYMYPQLVSVTDSMRFDLKRQLDAWHGSLEDLISDNADFKSQVQVVVMQLWYLVTSILFYGTLAGDEMFFDRFVADGQFESITSAAETALQASPASLPASQWSYSVDIGFVLAMYYVGIKCRQPALRRRVIAMMRAYPRCEAAYNSLECAAILQAIMDIEEDGLGVVVAEGDIPAASRIRKYEYAGYSSRPRRYALIRYLRGREEGPWEVRKVWW